MVVFAVGLALVLAGWHGAFCSLSLRNCGAEAKRRANVIVRSAAHHFGSM